MSAEVGWTSDLAWLLLLPFYLASLLLIDIHFTTNLIQLFL